MNLIFNLILTGLLIVLGLFPHGQDFPQWPLFALVCFVGLGASFLQQRSRPVPHLTVVANVLFLILAVHGLLPFVAMKVKRDVFLALLETWMYFLVISTFLIYRKRQYYIIQCLCLGLVVFACFYASNNPFVLLADVTLFLIVWIMALRSVNFLPENIDQEHLLSGTSDLFREVKVGAVAFLAVVLASLPFYFLLPRLDIPLLPLDDLLKQRYSAIYADFPKRGLVAFLNKNPEKRHSEKAREKGNAAATDAVATQAVLEMAETAKKPILWVSQEEYDRMLKRLQEIDRELRETAKERDLPNLEKNLDEHNDLYAKQTALDKEKDGLDTDLARSKAEYLKAAATAAESAEQMQKREDAIQQMINRQRSIGQASGEITKANDEIRSEVYAQSQATTQQIRLAWDEKETIEEQLRKVQPRPAEEEKLEKVKEETPPKAELTEEKKKEEEQKKEKQESIIVKIVSHLTILDIILLFLVTLLIVSVTRYLLFFMLPFIRHRRRIRNAIAEKRHNLAISLIYTFLGRVFSLAGEEYPIDVLPEVYQKRLEGHLGVTRKDAESLTSLFVVARYSNHSLLAADQEKALVHYENILEELRHFGARLHRMILKIPGIFDIR